MLEEGLLMYEYSNIYNLASSHCFYNNPRGTYKMFDGYYSVSSIKRRQRDVTSSSSDSEYDAIEETDSVNDDNAYLNAPWKLKS